MKTLPLSGLKSSGLVTVLSNNDYNRVADHRYAWYIGTRYIQSRTRVHTVFVQLHRWLLDAPAGSVADHINHDVMDNRRENLRLVDALTNRQHRRSNDEAVGVYWSECNGKWLAYSRRSGRLGNSQFIGAFPTQDEAICMRARFRAGTYVPAWKRITHPDTQAHG